jgi:hypothetical protein
MGAARWLCSGHPSECSAWPGNYARVLLTPARCADMPLPAREAGRHRPRRRGRTLFFAPVAGSDDAEARWAASGRCGGFAQSCGRRRPFDRARPDLCSRHHHGSCGRSFVRLVHVDATSECRSNGLARCHFTRAIGKTSQQAPRILYAKFYARPRFFANELAQRLKPAADFSLQSSERGFESHRTRFLFFLGGLVACCRRRVWPKLAACGRWVPPVGRWQRRRRSHGGQIKNDGRLETAPLRTQHRPGARTCFCGDLRQGRSMVPEPHRVAGQQLGAHATARQGTMRRMHR